MTRQLRIVAFGGGHGLYATLLALRQLSCDITAVVTVADDGGSSGRLRAEYGYLPPGDLRQAVAALADGTISSSLLQHRFSGRGDLGGHPVGNLLLTGAFDLLGDPVAGLDHIGRLFNIAGRVLPMSTVPLDIEADVVGLAADEITVVRGQAEVAVTKGDVTKVRLLPTSPPACTEAVAAIREADWLIFGPGSWFTSVLPHFLVPGLAEAIDISHARRAVVLNLASDSETSGWALSEHLSAIKRHDSRFRADVVLADSAVAADEPRLVAAARAVSAQLMTRSVADRTAQAAGTYRHDPMALAQALREIVAT